MTNKQEIERCGHMTKLGEYNKKWRRRWFVLSGSTLKYYRYREDSEPKGVIELDNCVSVRECADANKPNTIQIDMSEKEGKEGRVYYLCCEGNDLNEWLGAIARAVVRIAQKKEERI
eukprot:c22204_g1_i1.p1 GENE.c22204_g1_i1~~c22204_g1_i1.p1  ORF type:complete len:124 (+),score=39.72 c22204_g1_i1:23-373(+)